MFTTNSITLRISAGKELSIVPETIVGDTGFGTSFTGNCFIYQNQFDFELEEYKESILLGTLIENAIGLHQYEGKALSDSEIAKLISFVDNYTEPDYEDYEVVGSISFQK